MSGTDMSASASKRAKLRCMKLLQARDYTKAQLREKLLKDGYDGEVIQEALDYVESFHYVDDLRYAENYITCAQEQKGRRRIDAELARRGVPEDVIESAWEKWHGAGNELNEEEQIARLLKKRRYDRDSADLKEQQRTYAYLARRGFSGEQIYRALNDPNIGT